MLNIRVLFLLLLSCVVKSQDFNQNYFKTVLDSLTLDVFAGRGYSENGMEKAALYLRKEFKKHQLKSFTKKYEQGFSYPINVLHEAKLRINGVDLKYGIDFILKPSSKSVTDNKLPYVIFDTKNYISSFESKEKTRDFIVQDYKNQLGKNIILPPLETSIDSIQQYYKQWSNIYEKDDNSNRAIFRFTKDKLTSSLSQRQANISEFIISDKFYSKEPKIENFHIASYFVPDFKAKNIIGYIDGKNNDSVIVVTAHYDHLGKTAGTIFPGASDNASGTAMMMTLMNYYSKNKPKYKTVFIAFAGEEAGLLGADYYVNHPLFPLKDIKFLINLDIMGAGDQGIQVVNGKVFRDEFDRMVKINSKNNYVKEVKIRGESCNSDHCPFYMNGVPSFFIYTLGGKGFYHDPNDTVKNLNLSYSLKVFDLIKDFINGL